MTTSSSITSSSSLVATTCLIWPLCLFWQLSCNMLRQILDAAILQRETTVRVHLSRDKDRDYVSEFNFHHFQSDHHYHTRRGPNQARQEPAFCEAGAVVLGGPGWLLACVFRVLRGGHGI
ncbi:unnamed protein product [Durusdinium trenchii]|uniref:Secreted protein n=1 Tax=Durusdinium trenchii TaxID=1381693 RepID=A0ABP0MLL9_9DINO